MRLFHISALLICCFVLPIRPVLAWGAAPHRAITQAALEVLPGWQQALLGDQQKPLAEEYCLIPDRVFADRPNARFAMVEGRPTEVYRLNLHLPAEQAENLQTLRYFLGKSVESLRAGKIEDGAKYMGTICHVVEDYGSPSHTLPGDNMFTLLQQFLPPTDAMKDQLLHGPIETSDMQLDIAGYKPQLLGDSVELAAWRLLHRLHQEILNARQTTIPIIQALYAGDEKTAQEWRLKAATVDAQVLADALYTLLSLSAGRFDPAQQRALDSMAIGSLIPTEAEHLYFPQSQFFSSPNWGFPRSGVILAEGHTAVALKLRVAQGPPEEIRQYSNGISAGMGRTLTFLLPNGIYHHFTVLGGLHPELGALGSVDFKISGDNHPLASATVSGNDPAHAFDCNITNVTELQLSLTSHGKDAKHNYAIWGEPTLTR